jgi:hypothetical protein
LSGQRFEDSTDEMDVEDAEKNYLLIFDEVTKVKFYLIKVNFCKIARSLRIFF